MNRNTQIGILIVIVVLAVGGWFAYDMYATKTTPVVVNPNGQTPDITTPTNTNNGLKPYTVGETRIFTPNESISEAELQNAEDVKNITTNDKNIVYSVYHLSDKDAKTFNFSPIILKVLFNDTKEMKYFDTQIIDLGEIGQITLVERGIQIRCDSKKIEDDCTYQFRFDSALPPNTFNRNSLTVWKLVSDSSQKKYEKIVADFSNDLTSKGYQNSYTLSSTLFDTGLQYEISFTDYPLYKLFIMSSDYGIYIGEGGPIFFTPNATNFNTDTDGLRAQLIQPAGEYKGGTAPYRGEHISYSEKITKDGVDTFAVFAYCGYAESNYCVQILAEDSEDTGYLIHMDIDDTNKDNPESGVKSVIEAPIVSSILSSIKK